MVGRRESLTLVFMCFICSTGVGATRSQLQGVVSRKIDACPAFISSPTTSVGLPTVENTLAGQTAEVRCMPGFEPEQEYVTCDGDKFEPEPACKRIDDYCLGRRANKHGLIGVPDAVLGKKVRVSCLEGFEPQNEFVTCDYRGNFQPATKCQTVCSSFLTSLDCPASHCVWQDVKCRGTTTTTTTTVSSTTATTSTTTTSAITGTSCEAYIRLERQVSRVDATHAGKEGEVHCLTGFEPVEEYVLCDSGSFTPEPECTKIADFCLARKATEKGRAGTPDAALGEKVPVVCLDGFEPQNEMTTCDPRGNFAPTPKCHAACSSFGTSRDCPTSRCTWDGEVCDRKTTTTTTSSTSTISKKSSSSGFRTDGLLLFVIAYVVVV